MNISNIDLQKIFDTYNKKHFKGKLPKCEIILYTRWSRTIADIDGEKRRMRLNFDHHREKGLKEIKDSILHEMVHLSLQENGKQDIYHDHGKEFKEIAKKLGLKEDI